MSTPFALLAALLNRASPDAGVQEIPPPDFYRRALEEPVKTATAEDVAQWLSEKSAVLVDLRSPADFAARHIDGAVNLPATELTEERAKQLLGASKEARIVVYCDDQLLPTRRIALTTFGAPALRELGYTHLWRLEDLWMRRGELPKGFCIVERDPR